MSRCRVPFRRLWAVLLAVCVAGAAARAERFTVVTYNVENYGPADRMTEEGFRTAYPKPESEKHALRAVIRALDADVIVLQEMGPQPYLDELRRDLAGEGCDYPFARLARAADPDRHLAILARRQPKSVIVHADLEFPYFGRREPVKRGMLEATFGTSGGDVTLFAVHLKSRFTDRPDDPMSANRRAGEATAVRDRILRRFPEPAGARFLILGDCNDGRTSRTLGLLQKRGRTEIAALLPARDSRGETWTHVYRKEDVYSRVDHILVSPGLRDAMRAGGARIHDDENVRLASDHRPVVVVVEFP